MILYLISLGGWATDEGTIVWSWSQESPWLWTLRASDTSHITMMDGVGEKLTPRDTQ